MNTLQRLIPQLAAAMLMVALQGCGSPLKGSYFAAETQPRINPEEAAAQTAETSTPSGGMDTRETYLNLVDRMQQDELWFASLAHIDALEQKWGRSPASTRLRADALRHTDQAGQSGDFYRQLMGTPLEAAGYRGLGLLAGANGDYQQAVQMLEQAARRQPTDALLLSDLGYANLRSGRIGEARVPLMQALQLQPNSKQVQVNVALYLEASGQSEKASALMEAHQMSDPTRTAIREAGRRIARGSPSSPIATPSSTEALDDPRAPLMLRVSGWSARTTAPSASPISSAGTSR